MIINVNKMKATRLYKIGNFVNYVIRTNCLFSTSCVNIIVILLNNSKISSVSPIF